MRNAIAAETATFTTLNGEEAAGADVYRQFRQAILHARFMPGQLISLRALAAEFGVSTMPLREAASRLVAEGGLEAISRRGFRVPVIDATEAMQILSLRLELEGRAAAAAARHISEEEIAALEMIERRTEEAIAIDDVPMVLMLNTDFHLAIYRAAHDRALFQLIEILLLRYAPNLASTLARLEPAAKSGMFDRTHAMLIDALRERSPGRARRAVEDDIGQAAHVCWGTHI